MAGARMALAAVAVLAIAGCAKKEEEAAAPPVAPNTVVFAASDFTFQGPDTIPSGLTRVRLAGKGPSLHHIQFLLLGAGKTLDSLHAAMAHPGPLPAWVTLIPGPNPGVPGVDTTEAIVSLPPGHYAVVCFIPDAKGVPHVVHGMIKPLVVRAGGPVATAPTADVTIRLTDFDFTPSAPLTAGHHVLKIENGGQQPHEFVLAKLDSGATAQQLVDWIHHGMNGRPPARPMGGASGMVVGATVLVPVDLTPGDYGLFCFFPDKTDGKEHVMHGMMKQIHIS